mgnify:CR=1 FL=1
MKERNNNNLQLIAISFMILGMFFLSINDVTVKWLSKEYPIWEIVFFCHKFLSVYISNLKLIAGALCVICPTDILFTPVKAIFFTFFSVIPPEASVS